MRLSIASIGSGSTPRASASSRLTRSPSISAQSRRSERLSPAASIRTAGAPLAAIAAAVSSKRRRTARVLAAVLEHHRDALAPVAGTPAQPQISLWSASGSSAKKAGSFAFSLIWVFQRWATGAVRSAP